MKKIIILDFETGDIIIADFDTNIYDENQNITEFFDALGEVHKLELSESNCQWMIVNSLNLKVL
jgi:hypothetical protein